MGSSAAGAWLIVCACWVLAHQRGAAVPTREPRAEDEPDFEFERLAEEVEEEEEGEELEEEQLGSPEREALRREGLEPEAEMLPENFEGVKPPGVDHMEMEGARPGKDYFPGAGGSASLKIRRLSDGRSLPRRRGGYDFPRM